MSPATTSDVFAPITGDPEQLRATARVLGDHDERLSLTASRFVGSASMQQWQGDAAKAHTTVALDLSGRSRNAARACESAARDLGLAATALQQAQEQMTKLAQQAHDCRQDHSAAQGRSALAAATADVTGVQ